MNNNQLLKDIMKKYKEQGTSDTSYNEIYDLLHNVAISNKSRNSIKAKLKADLALTSVLSDILALLGILVTLGVIGNGVANTLFISIVVLIFALLYAFWLMPAIKRENYLLSVIEDIYI